MFQRNQIVWAIGAVMQNGRPGEMTDPVASTIKRLIDVDRKNSTLQKSGAGWERRYAFLPRDLKGTGTELQFSLEEAFALAIGVALDAFGAVQWGVIKTLRVLRPDFSKILETAHLTVRTMEASRTEKPPSLQDPSNLVFLVLQDLEANHILEEISDGRRKRFVNVCRGAEEMVAFMTSECVNHPVQAVIEINNLAIRLAWYLDRAPLRRRGRSAAA